MPSDYEFVDTLVHREGFALMLGRRGERLLPVSSLFPASDYLVDDLESSTQTALSIKHPALADTCDWNLRAPHRYIAWDLPPGILLADALEEPLGVARSVVIALQVSQGLGALHRYDLTHRVIEPWNIWLAQSGRVSLLHQGFASIFQSQERNRTGMTIIRDEAWLPESFAPPLPPSLDPAGDVYGVGRLLYRLLTGRTPFAALNEFDLMMRKTPPRPAHEVRADIPIALSELCSSMLSLDARARPRDGDTLAAALAPFWPRDLEWRRCFDRAYEV